MCWTKLRNQKFIQMNNSGAPTEPHTHRIIMVNLFSFGSHVIDRAYVRRSWRIVFLKVAYYATSIARNFAKLCQNYARIP